MRNYLLNIIDSAIRFFRGKDRDTNNTNTNEKWRNIIRASYKENFQRDISEKEIEQIFQQMFPRMEDELRNFKYYSAEEFKKYMNSEEAELLFAPIVIIKEINRIILTEGADAFSHGKATSSY